MCRYLFFPLFFYSSSSQFPSRYQPLEPMTISLPCILIALISLCAIRISRPQTLRIWRRLSFSLLRSAFSMGERGSHSLSNSRLSFPSLSPLLLFRPSEPSSSTFRLHSLFCSRVPSTISSHRPAARVPTFRPFLSLFIPKSLQSLRSARNLSRLEQIYVLVLRPL